MSLLPGGDNVNVKYGASTADLEAGAQRAAASVQSSTLRMSTSLEGLGTAIERVKVPFLALTTLMVGGEIFKETVLEVMHLADELDHLSAKTGISVEQLSRLSNAAKFVDVGLGSLATGFKKLSSNLQEVQKGAGAAAESFQLMGIKATDAHGQTRPLDDVLFDIADRFKGYADGANKSAIAVALFGRSGTDLIPFLNKGREGIEELMKVSDELGATMGEKDVKAATKYKDATIELGLATDGLKLALGVGLFPHLTRVVKLFESAAFAASHFKDTLKALLGGTWSGGMFIPGFVLPSTEGAGGDVGTGGAAGNPARKQAPSIGGGEARKKMLEQLSKWLEESAKHGDQIARASYEYQLELAHDNYAAKKELMTQELLSISATWGSESTQYTKMLQEIQRAEREHAAELTRIEDHRTAEANKHEKARADFNRKLLDDTQRAWEDTFGIVSRTVASSFEGLFQGTVQVQAAFQNMGRNILLSAIANIEKSLEVWLAAEVVKRTMGQATTKNSIVQSAWDAAAKTYASVAAIPFVGWLLAPAAAAGAAAAVLAFGANVSAAGGYDIPAGINPVVQTHAEEMILPKDIANGLRRMVGAGGGGGTVIIQAMDAEGVHAFLMKHSSSVFDAAQRAAANGKV